MKEGRGHPAAARAVGLTRAGMWWEALARAFWPLGVVLALVLAALAFGAAELHWRQQENSSQNGLQRLPIKR